MTKDPPTEGAYDAIKSLLLELHGRLPMDYAKELVRVRSLNGRSCKAHLSYMRGLVTSPQDAKGDMFRAVFIYSIPLHIRRPFLHSALSLDAIAKQADAQLFADQSGDLDNAGSVQHVAAPSAVFEDDPVAPPVPALTAPATTPAVDRIGFRGPRQSRPQQGFAPRQQPFRSRPQTPQSQPQRQQQSPVPGHICRNHQKFGPDTYTCANPDRCMFARMVAGTPALNSGAGRR